jgi:Na+/H+-dicarboxylate symporter
MKVWLKLLIGSLLGVLLGFLLPSDNQSVLQALGWLEEMAIRIGRYGAVPILVFSLAIAIYELRQDGEFWTLILRSFLVLIASAAFVIAAGIIVTLLFPPARIPILIEEQMEVVSLDTAGNILNLFPSNMFAALINDGVYLLPLYFFAFFWA